MSFARHAGPLASTLGPLARSSLGASSSSRLCMHCLRRAAPQPTPNFPAKRSQRSLATAAAHRPDTFDHPPTPPRNTGIPETSIATDADQNTQSSHQPASEKPLPEVEAQSPSAVQSKATGSVASPKGRKSKLRPRKAAMTLTPKAVDALRELLNEPEPKLIRVGVKNRGCSGLAYHLEYVDKPGSFDEAVDQDGVKVLIDSKALFSIIGSEMDWIEDKLSRRFVFKNPNITEQCGCGESFSIG